MSNKQAVKVLFVCMGNICRSPTAHAVFRKLVTEEGLSGCIEVDSAGTHAFHVGNPPDQRSMQTAQQRGIEMQDLRARKVEFSDLIEFDYVLVMDGANYDIVADMADSQLRSKVELFLRYAPEVAEDYVPDPYYGGAQGFEQVFDMVEKASRGLLQAIQQEHGERLSSCKA